MSFERNIKLLRWHSFFIDFSLWAPLAIIYFSHISGSYTLGLSIFSIVMISSAVFELPTGFFSDKYGRTKTIILGSFSFFIGAIFFAIGLNYWFLVAGAIAQGLGRAFYSGNNDALLYDNLASVNKINEFEEYNGKIGAMSQLALGISAIFSSLVAFVPLSVLLWISVIPQLICLVLSFRLDEVKTIEKDSGNIFAHIKEASKNFLTNFKLRQISLISIVEFGMNEASYQFRSAFINTLWPTWAIGFSQVITNLLASLSFKISGKVIKKFTAIKVLISKFFITKTIYLFSIIFPSVWSPAIMSSTSIFYGISEVSKNKLLQTEFTHKQRATMGSLNSLFGSLFFAVFAIFLGLLADKFGPRDALLIKSILGFITLIPLFRFYKADHEK